MIYGKKEKQTMSKFNKYTIDVMKPIIGPPSTIWKDYGFYSVETTESKNRREAYKIYTQKYTTAFAEKIKEMMDGKT